MALRNLAFQPRVGFNVPHTTVEGMLLWLPISSVFDDANRIMEGTIDPFAATSAQQFPLGTELWYGDRKFRYAKAGAVALDVGKLMQSVVPLAGHIDEDINVPAVGDTTIDFTPNTLTTDDLAANELADGYIHINSGTGLGYRYRIKSHPAILGAASGTLTLFDPIVVAPVAASKATVTHNRFRNVIIHPSPPTALVCGVTVCAVTASYYHWLQYEGPGIGLIDGTVVIGAGVMPSDGTDGAVEHWVPETDTAGEVESMGPIGFVEAVNATTEYGAIFWKIP